MIDASQPIFLASTSPRRTQLLSQAGISHIALKPEDDECVSESLSPLEVVQTLALRKAHSVRRRVQQGLIIGADTIVYLDGRIIGKPKDATAAHAMLRELSGREHEVYSGVAVVDAQSAEQRVGYRRVNVSFRPLTDHEIEAYIGTGEPLDKAGAYSIQGRGALFVLGIQGDYYAVVGLPLVLTAELLHHWA